MISSQPVIPFPPLITIALSILLFSLPQTCLSLEIAINSETPEMIMARLQQKYDAINSINFSFSQTTKGQLSGRPKSGQGEAFFIKDEQGGKMRWNYSGDEAQVLISDGSNLSMYFAKLKQMIVTPATTMRHDIMYSFFSGTGKLQDNFIPTPAEPTAAPINSQGGRPYKVIKLTPKETQSQVSNIQLFISEDSLIRRIEIVDHFDTLTILSLGDIQINHLDTKSKQALDSLFTFTPPEGTEIIHQ